MSVISVPSERRVAGLSDAVLSGTLRERVAGRTLPFAPTCFDAELLAAADAAVASRVPLGIVLPLPGTATPLLLGAAAVVGAVIARGALDVQIAVVSANLTSRTLYDRLYVRDQRLADFIPRARIDAEGVAQVTGRPAHDAGGRLHLTSSLDRLGATLVRLDGLVIDASAVAGQRVGPIVTAAAGGLPLLYLTADPGDAGLQVLRDRGGVAWGWDAASLGPLAASAVASNRPESRPVVADTATLRAAADSLVTIRFPQREGDLDAALAELWTSLGALSGAYRAAAAAGVGGDAAVATRWAWGVYNSLALLPVAPQRFDARAGANPYVLRLGQAPATARAFARNVGGEAGQAWYVVADALADALAAAARQEKLAELVGWIGDCVDKDRHALLVVRNATAVAAVTTALDESPHTPFGWPDHVNVITVTDLAAARFDGCIGEICLPGTLPRVRAGLLALPPAPEVTVLTTGPHEALRAARQAVDARVLLADLRAETARDSASALGVTVRHCLTRSDPAAQVRLDEHGTVRAVSGGELAGEANVWEPFSVDVVALLRETAGAGDGQDEGVGVAPARVIGGGASTLVRVVVIHLADGKEGGVLLAEPNDLLTRRSGSILERVAAKSLGTGDVVVLVDLAARHDLLGAVTAKLSESPAYAALASLVEFWHERARRVALTHMTYREILTRMQPGTAITTEETIGNWIRGDVDGPRDHDDVSRFAIAVRDPELRRQAEQVGWALKTLHRVNGKVAAWLTAQVSGAALSDADALVDPGLNIHVADLLEAVTAHKVTFVDTTYQVAHASALGVVLTRAEALRAVGEP